jgi:hypothetical protein
VHAINSRTPPLTGQNLSSQEIALTDEHFGILENCAAKFKAGDTEGREKIIRQAAVLIKRSWREDVEFDRDTVMKVCDLSAKIGYSHTFPAHSPTYVWQT